MIEKVISFGCSFSDYMRCIDKTYGEYVAEELGVEYIHEGSGAGSNQRIFRKFFEYLKNGTINENTLVTLQFTQVGRDELWFHSLDGEKVDNETTTMNFIEPYEDGGVFKYKWDTHTWGIYFNEDLLRILKDKTDFCLNDNFEIEKSENMAYSIVEICKSKNIPFVFLDGSYSGYMEFDKSDIKVVKYDDIRKKHPAIRPDGSKDELHTSQDGMNEIAKRILKLW